MPAVADIQNTIVKEFAGDPRVVAAVMSQGETAELLETFWSNVYLRGRMIFDPDGAIAEDAYAQPETGLPASRAAVIAPDQTIALSHFGHDPALIIQTIRSLLMEMVDPLVVRLEETQAGTLLSWSELPEAASFDVIRGSLDNLVSDGRLIDLGPVECIEAGSTDETTTGFEDAELPDPGEAFFYLVRPSAGVQGYGADSLGHYRTPTSGDCP